MAGNNTSLQGKFGIIIGGSGLVGGAIVHYFKKKWGCEILAPNSKQLSIRDSEDIRGFFQELRPDFIINSAIAAIDSNPKISFEINYLGTINIAKVAAALGIPYIFFSSAAVLPEGENLTEENHRPLRPAMSNYAKSKLMSELTLEHLRKTEGLDHTVVRLAIVYGKHDHKIQGFHRLLFSVADQSMPMLFTGRNVCHSYSNAKKIPYFLRHILLNREEFSGQTFHFVDPNPVRLAQLILTIRSYLELKRPREMYLPYPVARFGANFLKKAIKQLIRLGIDARMPPELMFLKNFYETQTLSAKKLKSSSFVDSFPNESVFTQLPEVIQYYLTRWEQLNLIAAYDKEFFDPQRLSEEFLNSPETLLADIHADRVSPFSAFRTDKQ
ncbi:MAG: NAD-dependent epimerase/dehydratase family protein [Deltaproteobacteria bacterium]|nr:NAD-dependent epimerase/dehydratase family protein [Deltaproteobacteria bacterium]